MEEAAEHPHIAARGTITEAFGVRQPAPAPRFDRTPSAAPAPPATPGQHTVEALTEWGLDADRVEKLRTAGVVKQT
jgi:alpha-methylacyl-CoA racemase